MNTIQPLASIIIELSSKNAASSSISIPELHNQLQQHLSNQPNESFGVLLAMTIGQDSYASLPFPSRSLSTLTLKKLAVSQEPAVFLNLPTELQQYTKESLLKALFICNDDQLLTIIADCIGAIAELALYSDDGWETLLPTLFSQFMNTQNLASPTVFVSIIKLISQIIQCHFASIVAHLQQLVDLIHFIFDQNNKPQEKLGISDPLSFLRLQVYTIHVLLVICALPEFTLTQQMAQQYWNTIVNVIEVALHNNQIPLAQTIISQLIDSFIANGETDILDFNIEQYLLWTKNIVNNEHLPDSFRQSALELLITYAENNQNFPINIPKPKSKKSKSATKPTKNVSPQQQIKRQMGQQLLLTLLELSFTAMSNVPCDLDWVIEYNTSENSLESRDIYNDQDTWHQAGLFTFSRLLNLLTTTTIKTTIMPTIIQNITQPIMTCQELSNQTGIGQNNEYFQNKDIFSSFLQHCLADNQYNISWKQQVAALTALSQIAIPKILDKIDDVILSQIINRLIFSSQPRVQYSSLLLLSGITLEYGVDIIHNASNIVEKNAISLSLYINNLSQILLDFHAPCVQQIASVALQSLLDILGDIDENNDKNGKQLLSFFTPQTVEQLVNMIITIFQHPLLSQKSDAIGLQLSILPCIAQIAAIKTDSFLPLVNSIFSFVSQKLNLYNNTSNDSYDNDGPSPHIQLQCKAIECKSFILHTLYNNSSSKNDVELQKTISYETQTFANQIITLFSQLPPLQTFQNQQQQKQQQCDREYLLKFILRGLSRIAIVLGQEQIHIILQFVMTHLVVFFDLSMNNIMKQPLTDAYIQDSQLNSSTSIHHMAEVLGTNGSSDSLTSAEKLSELTKIDIMHEDLSVALSMIEVYLQIGKHLLLPWSHKLLEIVLFYSNYPQNAEIQRSALAAVPHLVQTFQYVLYSDVSQQLYQPQQQYSPLFATNFDAITTPKENISPIYENRPNTQVSPTVLQWLCNQNITQYELYTKNSFLQTFLSASVSTPCTTPQLSALLTTSTENTILVDCLSTGVVPYTSSLSSSLLDQEVNCGSSWILPNRQQSARAIIYIIQCMFYYLHMETDHESSISLLSCLGLINDQLSDIFLTISQCDIMYQYLQYAQEVCQTAHNSVFRHIISIFRKNYKKTHTNYDDGDDDDSDDDGDDGDGENEEGNDNDVGNTDAGSSKVSQHDSTVPSNKNKFKTNFEILPTSSLPTELSAYYGYYPLDDTTLSSITEKSDFLTEQTMMCISHLIINLYSSLQHLPLSLETVFQQQLTNYTISEQQKCPVSTQLHRCYTIVTHFSHIIQKLFIFTQSTPNFSSALLSSIDSTCRPYFIPQHYLFSTQRLPYMLCHSLIQTFQNDFITVLFISKMTQIPHMLFSYALKSLYQCHDILTLYTASYKTTSFTKSQILSLHSYNVGVLTEHLTYMFGLLLQYSTPFEALLPWWSQYITQSSSQVYSIQLLQNNLTNITITFPTIAQNEKSYKKLLSTTVFATILSPSMTLLSQIGCMMKLYASMRYRNTYRRLQSHFYSSKSIEKTLSPQLSQLNGLNDVLAKFHVIQCPFIDQAISSTNLSSWQLRSTTNLINYTTNILPTTTKDTIDEYFNDSTSLFNSLNDTTYESTVPNSDMTDGCERFFYGLDNTLSSYTKSCYISWSSLLSTVAFQSQQQQQQQQTCLPYELIQLHVNVSNDNNVSLLINPSSSSQQNVYHIFWLTKHLIYIMYNCLPFYRDLGELSSSYQLLAKLFLSTSTQTFEQDVMGILSLSQNSNDNQSPFLLFWQQYSTNPSIISLVIQAIFINFSSYSSSLTLLQTLYTLDNVLLTFIYSFIRSSSIVEISPSIRWESIVCCKILISTLYTLHNGPYNSIQTLSTEIPLQKFSEMNVYSSIHSTVQSLSAISPSQSYVINNLPSFNQIFHWLTSVYFVQILPTTLHQVISIYEQYGEEKGREFSSITFSNLASLLPSSADAITSQPQSTVSFQPNPFLVDLYSGKYNKQLLSFSQPYVISHISSIYLLIFMLTPLIK